MAAKTAPSRGTSLLEIPSSNSEGKGDTRRQAPKPGFETGRSPLQHPRVAGACLLELVLSFELPASRLRNGVVFAPPWGLYCPAVNRTIESYRRRLQDPERARKYARRFKSGDRKRIDRREQRAVRLIFSELADCLIVLDVPSGAGRFAPSLGENGRKVLEMDAAFEVLELAREQAGASGWSAAFTQADASRLPLARTSVDAVFCNRLLHHLTKVEERAIILRELHRVTRRYAIVSFFNYRGFGLLRKLLKRLRGRKPIYDGQPTLQEFAAEARQCGFRVNRIVPTGGPWVSQKYCVLEKV